MLESLSGVPTVAYLGAAVLFILSLGGLSNQETARRGNVYGIVGMTIAIAATFLLAKPASMGPTAWGMILVPVVAGGAIGAVMAQRVAMTGMPQLVALLHSFVGLAAVLVGISSALHPSASSPLASERWMNMVDVEPCGAASTLRTSRPWKTVASSAEASFA